MLTSGELTRILRELPDGLIVIGGGGMTECVATDAHHHNPLERGVLLLLSAQQWAMRPVEWEPSGIRPIWQSKISDKELTIKEFLTREISAV